jgi:hypothetical protein
MIWSVTVTKFETGRSVRVGGGGAAGCGVGACAYPVEHRAYSRAALSRDFLIEHIIVLSLVSNPGPVDKEILIEADLLQRHNVADVEGIVKLRRRLAATVSV